MTPILQILQNIIPAQDNFRAKLPLKARVGVIALLVVLAFIIFIFQAQFLMRYMIALLPIFYVVAVLAVGAKRALYGTAVFLFFYFALWVRVGPPYHSVFGGFGGNVVNFETNDADYHVRLIENLVHNFPHRMAFDPYTLYPTGQQVPFAPFYDFLIALVIWIAGLGHPSLVLTDTMAAYYPAVLGALVTIPVYFIGKEVFKNRKAGLLAAGMIAILPGEFLARSLLGNTDHHIAETLFSTIAMLFLIMAVKHAQEKQPTFSNIKNKEWSNLKKPLILSALAGLMLGFYLLTWTGGSLFIFVIFAYFVLQHVLDHLHGKSTEYLLLIGLPIFLLPIVMVASFLNLVVNGGTALTALAVSVIAISCLSPLSLIMNRKSVKRIFYPISILILGLALALILDLTSPSSFQAVMTPFKALVSSAQSLTIMEAAPFLSNPYGASFLHRSVWQYFTTGIFIAPVALLVMIYSAVRAKKYAKWLLLSLVGIFILTVIIWVYSFSSSLYCRPINIAFLVETLIVIGIYCYFEKDSGRMLLVVWSFVMLICLLGQTRFGYYFAVNIALLSCYVLWKMPAVVHKIFQLVGWKEALAQKPMTAKALRKSKNKELEERRAFNYFKPRYVSGFLSIIIIFFLTVYPNLLYGSSNDSGWSPKNSLTISQASYPYSISTDWYDAMIWMKNNTPEPFGNDSFYYSIYQDPSSGNYSYPSTAYGVMSWWDYGHWITCIAHRIPNANPFQAGIGGIGGSGANASANPGASTFLLAQDEQAGSQILDALGSRYIVINFETAVMSQNTIFPVIPTWAGQNQSDYYDTLYYQTSSGEVSSVNIFYPAYYQSMVVRLYTFGAQAAVPNNSTWALSYTEEPDNNGHTIKVLTGAANNGSAFATYEEAAQFVNDHPGYKIVGVTPLMSPIPLDALKGYALKYSSPSIISQGENGNLTEVEIFEYTAYKK